MLYRAVILTYAVGWTIDRLYEAGADESVSLLGYQLATPQAGAVLAAVGCTATSLALLVQRQLFPVRLIAAAEKQLEEAEAAAAAREQKEARRAALAPPGPQGLGGSRRETKLEEGQRMRKVLEKVRAWGVGWGWGARRTDHEVRLMHGSAPLLHARRAHPPRTHPRAHPPPSRPCRSRAGWCASGGGARPLRARATWPSGPPTLPPSC